MEPLRRSSSIRTPNSPELRLALDPSMLDLDVPTRRLGRVNNGRDLLVATGLVVLLARGAGAGGVEARGVGGALAGDVEVVGAVAGGAVGVEVGDVPGQGWAGLALGEGFEGAGQGDGGEEGGGEEGGELHCGGCIGCMHKCTNIYGLDIRMRRIV